MASDNNMVFLTGKWKNIIHINYRIDDEMKLSSLLPPGTRLDKFQNNAWVSVIAHEFSDTAVKGIPIPVYGDFPEINFRFYVTDDFDKKGVVFIKEYIPRTAIALAANMIFSEHFRSIEMKSTSEPKYDNFHFKHDFTVEDKNYSIEAITEKQSFTPIDNSPEHFFKQRNCGFSINKEGKTIFYDIEHDKWRIYPNNTLNIKADFGHMYGKEWEFLNDKKPDNWFVADGGAVKLYDRFTKQVI